MSNKKTSSHDHSDPSQGGSLGFYRPRPSLEGRVNTLQNYEPLKKGENPYSSYNGDVGAGSGYYDVVGDAEVRRQDINGDGESVDDGINMDISPSHSDGETGDQYLMSSKPSPDVVQEMFEEFLEVNSPMRQSEEDSFRRMSIDEKWKHVHKQQTHAPIYDASHYVSQLKNHGALSRRRKSWGRSSRDNLSQLSFMLRKLKEDLHMAYASFVNEFVSHGGVSTLVAVLKEIQTDQQATGTGKKKLEFYNQFVQDEYDCLLCVKFSKKHKDSMLQLITMDQSFDYITQCLYSSNIKTRIVTLQLLCLVCDVSQGHTQVVKSISNLRLKNNEMVRFHTLVTMLNKRDSIKFQVWCVRLFNKLWKCTQVVNAKVYLQYELQEAGFDPDALDRYGLDRGTNFENLQKELDIWRQNYINVASSRQELVELENRNNYLRREIDIQNEKIKDCEAKLGDQKTAVDTWKNKCDHFRERAAELQTTVEKLSTAYKERTGEAPDPSVKADEATRPLDIYGTTKSIRFQGRTSRAKSLESNALLASLSKRNRQPRPSLQIPAPPQFRSDTVGRKFLKSSKSNLPLLHLVPILTVTDSLFEDIDDEAKLREIDFTDFESKFKLAGTKDSGDKSGRFQKMLEKSASKLTFVEVDRAKFMIITKRRIGKSAEAIAKAIDTCDMQNLDGEMAQELLKYIPTKEEVKQLTEHSLNHNNMGEAEQFLFELMHMDRLESKLNSMTFMGMFDEMANTISPAIDTINRNSQNVLQCDKLKKVFEIILAFGNYMNSNKRGYVLGFKLESLKKLSEVKSTQDKSLTLLHYLEEFLSKNYPELHPFYEELDLTLEKGVSYQAIFADMVSLRKGLDLLKFEIDKQPDNHVIADFYHIASGIVTDIADSFHPMERVYEKVCLMFGENYKTVETEDIFRPLIDFREDFERAIQRKYKIANPVTTPMNSPRTVKHTKQPHSPSKSMPNGPNYSNTSPRQLHSPSKPIPNAPTYSNTTPQKSVSSKTKFSFDLPTLNSKSTSQDENDIINRRSKPNGQDSGCEDNIYLEPKPSAVKPEASSLSVEKMSSSDSWGIPVGMIPEDVLEERRKMSEASLSSQDSDINDIKASTSHSRVFPAVKRSQNKLSKSTSNISTKDVNNKPEHKPVIKTTTPHYKAKKDVARKLPRVPIDSDAETYYNAYRIGRTPSKGSRRPKANNILPDKPSVTNPQSRSFSLKDSSSVYEELPHGRLNGHVDSVEKSVNKDDGGKNKENIDENPPRIPIKTEEAYMTVSSVGTGSLKRRAPKPPAPIPPATYPPPTPIDKQAPATPNTLESRYRSQVSKVLNELNSVLDMASPATPTPPITPAPIPEV